MRFNLNLIYKFFKKRMGLTRKDIAKEYFHCSASKLSKPNNFTAEELYEVLFDVRSKKSVVYGEDESVIFDALKLFMGEVDEAKIALSGIWDEKYEDFALEMLRRAITQPYSSKSKKETPNFDKSKPKIEIIEAYSIPNTIEFDEALDSQTIKLRHEILHLNEMLDKGNLKRNDVPVLKFVTAFEKAVVLGRSLNNTIGWLNKFINDIDNLFSKWNLVSNQLEPDITELGNHLELILRDLRRLVYNYFIIRNEYLLTRKIDIPDGVTPAEQMLIIFDQAIRDWDIYEYIYGAPHSSSWIENFAKSINVNIERQFEYKTNEAVHRNIKVMYNDIIEFTKVLIDYNLLVGYLCTGHLHSNSVDLSAQDEGDGERILHFKKAAIEKRQRLIFLYNKIRSEVYS